MVEKVVRKLVIWSPLLQVLVLCSGILSCFLVAFYKGDVTIYMPYISETGAIVPEMGVFSATLTYGSMIGIVVVLYRYIIIKHIVEATNSRHVIANKISVAIGVISMAGCCLIAAFPMSTVLAVHIVGAIIHFGLAVLYLLLQTYLSFKTTQPYYNKTICVFRSVLSIAVIIIGITLLVTVTIAIPRWNKLHPNRLMASKTPQDEGFGISLTSAICEWLFYFTFLVYMYTFLKEFTLFKPSLSVKPTHMVGEI